MICNMEHLHDVVTDYDRYALMRGYVFREGFVFTCGSQANVFDAILIKSPKDCTGIGYDRLAASDRTLEEHIAFINAHKLEYADILTENLDFITQCPTLKHLRITPARTAPENFDYSPLYGMPEIRKLRCSCKEYGPKFTKSTSIDLSRVPGLRDIGISSNRYLNYDKVPMLEVLELYENKKHRDLHGLCAPTLKELVMSQCSIKTLEGMAEYPNLQSLHLYYLRSLSDISALVSAGDTLRALTIQNCPKVTDFSCLHDLTNLEHLNLEGRNVLPSLDFLKGMKKLKTFVFSMEVADRDIRPCLDVPYAHMSNRKREYNLTDKDLPKCHLTEPFRLL